MVAPPNRGGLNSTYFRGTHVPVEEPSTASRADGRASPAPHAWYVSPREQCPKLLNYVRSA
jgi:hypothetical protein